MYAILAAVFYAAFILIVYRLRNSMDSLVILFVSAFGSLFILGIVSFSVEGVSVPRNFRELWLLFGTGNNGASGSICANDIF